MPPRSNPDFEKGDFAARFTGPGRLEVKCGELSIDNIPAPVMAVMIARSPALTQHPAITRGTALTYWGIGGGSLVSRKDLPTVVIDDTEALIVLEPSTHSTIRLPVPVKNGIRAWLWKAVPFFYDAVVQSRRAEIFEIREHCSVRVRMVTPDTIGTAVPGTPAAMKPVINAIAEHWGITPPYDN